MNERKLVYRAEGNGWFHVRISLSKEECIWLKLEYPIEVDVYVFEAAESADWEKEMRKEIQDALYQTYDFWFEKIPWTWDLEPEENRILFRNDGNGEYHIRIMMSEEQCAERKLEYPIEVDVFVAERVGTPIWEEKIREQIEDAVFQTILPENVEIFHGDVFDQILEEVVWTWNLEEEKNISADRDPFSDQNRDRTLNAYRLLIASKIADGKKEEIRKMFHDGDYAQKLFEMYHIPNSPYTL